MLSVPVLALTFPKRSALRPSEWLGPVAPVLIIVAATILFRAPAFGNAAYDFDEQLYSLIGQRWLDGLLPYADSWDRKPPGLFAIFAISHWIGGSSAMAYQIPALMAAIAGSLLMYALARPFVARGQAVLVALTYSFGLILFWSGSAQSEVFFVPLLLGALLLLCEPRLSRRRAVAAMLLLGCALQIKYSVWPFCILLGLYALMRRRREHRDPLVLLQDALLFMGAGLLPTIGFFLYFLSIGQFEPFWQSNFVSFFARKGFGRFSGSSLGALCLLAPPAIGGLLTIWRSRPDAMPRRYALYCLFAVAATTTVFFPGTVYFYYFATLLPASLLLALPLFQERSLAKLSGQALYLTVLLGGWLASGPIERSASERHGLAQLTAAIRPHVDADRCLFIYDGPAALYRLTDACIPTRFVYPDHLNNRLERGALGTSQLGELAKVIRSRPQVIVSSPNPVAFRGEENDRMVAAALERDYTLSKTVVLQKREITVWLLSDAGTPD